MILELTNPTVIPTSGKHFQMINIDNCHLEYIHLLTRLIYTIVAYLGTCRFRNSIPGANHSNTLWIVRVSKYIRNEIIEFDSNVIQSWYCLSYLKFLYFHQVVEKYSGLFCGVSTARKISCSGWRAKISRKNGILNQLRKRLG